MPYETPFLGPVYFHEQKDNYRPTAPAVRGLAWHQLSVQAGVLFLSGTSRWDILLRSKASQASWPGRAKACHLMIPVTLRDVPPPREVSESGRDRANVGSRGRVCMSTQRGFKKVSVQSSQDLK